MKIGNEVPKAPRLSPDEKEGMAHAYADIHQISHNNEVLSETIFKISALEKVADIEKTKFGRGLVQVVDGMVNLGVDAGNILIKVINLIPFPDPASFERGYAHELDEMESLEHVPIKNAAETLAWLREQAEQLLAEQSVEDGEVANEE